MEKNNYRLTVFVTAEEYKFIQEIVLLSPTHRTQSFIIKECIRAQMRKMGFIKRSTLLLFDLLTHAKKS